MKILVLIASKKMKTLSVKKEDQSRSPRAVKRIKRMRKATTRKRIQEKVTARVTLNKMTGSAQAVLKGKILTSM